MGKQKGTFTCPRREVEGHADRNSPLVLDGPNKDIWRKDGTCSYDGSISSERFLELIREGAKIGPTDKSYKFYIDSINDQVAGAGKFYTHHLTPEQGWDFHRLWKDRAINWGYPGNAYTRLYIPGPSTECCENPTIGTQAGADDDLLCLNCGNEYRYDERRES